MSNLTLAASGVARACIVLETDASPTERHAAEELNHHLELICGARLPIESTPAAGQAAILIGRSLASQNGMAGFDWSTLGEDGVVVRAAGNHLLLAGATPRGSLYAVYEFLEGVLGCRWLTAACSVIPRRETVEVPGDLDIVRVPSFRYREPFYGVGDDADWASRNRVNGQRFPLDEARGGKWEYAGFVHTFYELLSPAEYFAAHPEYFSEINGERIAVDAQLCLTNPAVLDIVTENARRRLHEQPGARVLSVSQNDCWNNCQCPDCRALDEAEGSPSGTLVHFVNGVAERLEAEFPDVFVDTLAYTYTVKPPIHARPRRNVIIRLCHMAPCCDGHPLEKCELNRDFVGYLHRWGTISPEVFVWDYFTNFAHYLMPFPNFDAICEDVPLFARAGVTGLFCQGDGNPSKGPSEFAELRAYLFAKLLWNAELDGRAVINEFLDLYYGTAAQPIRDYIELMHGVVRDRHVHFNLYSSLDQPFLTPEILAKADALFEEAARRVEGDQVLSDRVAVARLSPEYVHLKRNFRYELAGDRYGLPGEEVTRRSKPFFALAKAHGIGALREGGRSLEEEDAGLRGYEALALEVEGWKLIIVPGMGGRILSLIDPVTNEDWMHVPQPFEEDYPFTGGYEEYSQAQWHSPGWRNEYSHQAEAASARLAADLGDGLELQRTYQLESGALSIESRLVNTSDVKRKVTLRSHPDFASGDWSTTFVEVRRQDNTIRTAAPWKGSASETSPSERGSLWLEESEMPCGAWSLVRGHRRLTIEFEPAQVDKCLLDWNRAYQSVCLELFAKTQWLDPGESALLRQRWSFSSV